MASFSAVADDVGGGLGSRESDSAVAPDALCPPPDWTDPLPKDLTTQAGDTSRIIQGIAAGSASSGLEQFSSGPIATVFRG